MTTRTRRLVLLAALVVALAIPTEMVLLQAITQDDRTAAAIWVDGLTSEELVFESGRLEQFPIQYRKAMLRRLGPAKGAAIWQRHITRYRDEHTELSTGQVEALNAVLGLISAETFEFPTTEERTASKMLADRVTELFGEDVTRYLMHDLGPRHVTFTAQATPIRQRLQDFVREHFVVNAGDGGSCDCNADYECDAGGSGDSECADAAVSGCTLQPLWPACGFVWLETCDGQCRMLIYQ